MPKIIGKIPEHIKKELIIAAQYRDRYLENEMFSWAFFWAERYEQLFKEYEIDYN